MRWAWWIVIGSSGPACVGYDADDGSQVPADDACSRLTIDAPTREDTWTTDQPLVTVSGFGGRPPIRWRNLTTGASGDGEVVETIHYEPWFCPEGCTVRRFGASAVLAHGANEIEVSDESCTDRLAVAYIDPPPCSEPPGVTITAPSSGTTASVPAGGTLIGGDSTGEIVSVAWEAGLAVGMLPVSAGPWGFVLDIQATTVVDVRVTDRCGTSAADSILVGVQ